MIDGQFQLVYNILSFSLASMMATTLFLLMKVPSEEASQKCLSLGLSSALMIILGYPGELIVEGDLSQRWMYWMLAMLPFCYVVYELLVGLAAATASEADPQVRDLVFRAQWVTVVSWLTYPA